MVSRAAAIGLLAAVLGSVSAAVPAMASPPFSAFAREFGPGVASAQTSPADEVITPVEILWPVPYYASLSRNMTGNSKRLEALLKNVDVPHHITFIPIKRAFHLYSGQRNVCMPHGGKPVVEGDIISQPFATTEHWFYVRSHDGLKGVREIKSAATIEGVERFFHPKGYDWIDWQYAPTYQALIAMLDKGRVQAVTLGPLVADGILPLPDGIERIGDKPFASLALRLHCRPSPAAKELVNRLNAVVDAGGR